jgi:hypothetical protein
MTKCLSTENSLLENDEPVLIKRHFLMEVRVLKIKKNTVFLNHFNLCNSKYLKEIEKFEILFQLHFLT